MKKSLILTVFIISLTAAFFLIGTGCSNSSWTNVTAQIEAAALYNSTDGSFVIANVNETTDDANRTKLWVNDTELDYGLKIPYEGKEIGTLPIYYKEMNFKPGEQLYIKASSSNNSYNYFRRTVIIPDEPTLSSPIQNASYSDNDSIAASWSDSPASVFYYANFTPSSIGEEESFEEITTKTALTVPYGFTVPGSASFFVAGVNGDGLDQVIYGEPFGFSDSYFIAASYDYSDVTINAALTAEYTKADGTKAAEALRLLKQEEVLIDNIKFTRMIYDATQITSTGTTELKFYMKKWNFAVARIDCLDMNQQPYFNWSKKWLFKSSGVSVTQSAALQPYSTVIVHVKGTDLNSAQYNY